MKMPAPSKYEACSHRFLPTVRSTCAWARLCLSSFSRWEGTPHRLRVCSSTDEPIVVVFLKHAQPHFRATRVLFHQAFTTVRAAAHITPSPPTYPSLLPSPRPAVVFLITLAVLGLQTLLSRPFRVLLLNIVWFLALLCLMGLSLLLVLKRTRIQQALLESPYINDEAWTCVGMGLGAILLGTLFHLLRRSRNLAVWPVAVVSRRRTSHQRIQHVLKQGHSVLERCWHGSRFLVRSRGTKSVTENGCVRSHTLAHRPFVRPLRTIQPSHLSHGVPPTGPSP